MAGFSRQVLSKFKVSVQKLETTLGPDTGDLVLRVATAGVLRGDRSRFQFFGDIMNYEHCCPNRELGISLGWCFVAGRASLVLGSFNVD